MRCALLLGLLLAGCAAPPPVVTVDPPAAPAASSQTLHPQTLALARVYQRIRVAETRTVLAHPPTPETIEAIRAADARSRLALDALRREGLSIRTATVRRAQIALSDLQNALAHADPVVEDWSCCR